MVPTGHWSLQGFLGYWLLVGEAGRLGLSSRSLWGLLSALPMPAEIWVTGKLLHLVV
jgi:hypothetical protein